jgi:hypothetical protein
MLLCFLFSSLFSFFLSSNFFNIVFGVFNFNCSCF